MCFGGAPVTKDDYAAQLSAWRKARDTAKNGGAWDEKQLKAKPADFDSWDQQRKDDFWKYGGDGEGYKLFGDKNYMEGNFEAQLGDEYTDPVTGISKAGGKPAPDITDDLVKKARTSMALRLQTTRGTKSTFSSKSSMGGLDLGKPVLGGY